MSHDRRAQLPVYRLRFENHPGLTVAVRRPGLRGLLDIAEATSVLRRSVRESWPDLDVRNLRAWQRLSRAFAGSLVSWDLVADGEPVAPTLAGVLDQDLDLLIELVRGWQQAIQQDLGIQRAVDAEPDTEDADDADPDVDPDEDADPAVDEEWLAQLPATVAVVDEPDDEEQPALRAVSDA